MKTPCELFRTRFKFNNVPDAKVYQTMVGSHVLPNINLMGTGGEPGMYFIFSDLSVRLEGKYRLKFTLYDIAGDGDGVTVSDQKGKILAEVFSDPFTVVDGNVYPGLMGL
jgi:Velvet factor